MRSRTVKNRCQNQSQVGKVLIQKLKRRSLYVLVLMIYMQKEVALQRLMSCVHE